MNEGYIDPQIGRGWLALTEALRRELARLPGAPAPIVGIDSFGLLTISVEGVLGRRRDVQALLRSCRRQALTVCEHCGEPGVVRSGSVMTVTCDRCS